MQFSTGIRMPSIIKNLLFPVLLLSVIVGTPQTMRAQEFSKLKIKGDFQKEGLFFVTTRLV